MKKSLTLILASLTSIAALAGETEKQPLGEIFGCTVAFEIAYDARVAHILSKKGYFAPNPENVPTGDADFTFSQILVFTQDVSHEADGKYYAEEYKSVNLGFSSKGVGLADRTVAYDNLFDRATYALKKNAFVRDLPDCEDAKKLVLQQTK